MSELLDAARKYLRRGWMPVYVPLGTKGPTRKGWRKLRLTQEDLPKHFDRSGNIGIVLGEASHNLVDVDLDCPEAIELADQYLPATPAVTGRPSAQRSHRWYYADVPAIKQFHDPKTNEMIVELRSNGGQTLVGPSRHNETDEPYDYLEGEPARVDAERLHACVKALYEEVVRRRYGALPEKEKKKAPATPAARPQVDSDACERRALAYLEKMPAAVSGSGGHRAAYAAATAMVHGVGLTQGRALQILMDHYNSRCQPPWSEKELLHKVKDAATKAHSRPFGWLRDQEQSQEKSDEVNIERIVEKAQGGARKDAPTQPEPTPLAEEEPPNDEPPTEVAPYDRCLKAMRRMKAAATPDGSLRLFKMVCRCIEHGLGDEEAVACIRECATSEPFPGTFTDADILKRIRAAEKHCERGSALETDQDGLIALGCRDPETGKLVLAPRRTLPTAQAHVREFQMHPEGRTLHNYAGLLMEWHDNHYVVVEDAALKKRLQPWLHDALRYLCDKRSGNMLLVPFESNPGTVNAALETLRNYVYLPADLTPPVWLPNGSGQLDPREILSCKTHNLHIPTGRIIPATPALFTTTALDFDHDANATAPVAWIGFLKQLFGDDVESMALLQDWFGYCLTPDTAQQKMLLVVGPKRSGKGTIGRVLRELIGHDNVVGPTTSGLAGQFGLQPLIGKSLAIVSDARFSGQDIQTVIERLLCISGEDILTVDRKHLSAVTMRLAARFMFLTNELPKLNDASGALAGRFVILWLTETFYGREDHGLTDRLLKELPGILLWALQGWSRLHTRGYFVQPKSVDEAVLDLEDLASPVGAFVRDRCIVAPGLTIEASQLYETWKAYCEEMGRDHAGTRQSFGRNLRAAVPSITSSNRRGDDGRDRFYEGIALKP